MNNLEFQTAFQWWTSVNPKKYAQWRKNSAFPTQEELEELWFTVENMAVASHIGNATTITPTQLLYKVMEWEHKTLLDPTVSKAAQDLIQRGKEEKLLEILAPEELEKNDRDQNDDF